MDYTNLARDEGVNAEGLIYDLGSLYTYLEQVKDTRLAKGKRYPLAMLLILMLLAKFGGEDQPSGIAEWVAHRQEELRALKLLSRARPPSHMTYRRILQRTINPSDFEVLISEYQRKHLAEGKTVVFSLDGRHNTGW